jgi:uncharacterized membrane protein
MASSPGGNALACYVALFAVIVARFWVLPLRDGFWLDETGTVWAIQGRLRDVIAHCYIWPSQSPAYCLIAWLSYRLQGPHEVMLRLPSFLAMAASSYLLYRLAVRLIGRSAAWPAVIVFASIEPVAFAATDARPYAIGLLAVIGAMTLLVRWFDTGRWLDCLGYCLLASLSVYMHFLFGITLLIHLVYAIYRARAEKRVSIGNLVAAAVLVALLLVPLALYMLSVLRTAQSHAFAGTPSGAILFELLAPPILVGTISLVLLFGYLAKVHLQFDFSHIEESSLILLASWVLLPVFLLYGISSLTNLKAFLPRYTLPAEAAIALFAGWLISAILPLRTRLIVISAVVLATLFYGPPMQFSHGGDWRAAMASVRSTVGTSETPVLIRSDFPESEPFNWLNDETRKDYLFAPLKAYPSAGAFVPLPMLMTSATYSYLDQLTSRLERGDRFLLVNMGDTSYQNWLLGRFSAEGFQKKRIGSFGGSLTVDEYFRPSQTSEPSKNN